MTGSIPWKLGFAAGSAASSRSCLKRNWTQPWGATGKGGAASSERAAGSRHGHRERGLMGTFGATTIRVPRARLTTPHGKTAEWRNATLPAYQRRTRRADALIAGAYLS